MDKESRVRRWLENETVRAFIRAFHDWARQAKDNAPHHDKAGE